MTIVIDDGHAVAECKFEPFGGIISATNDPSKISHFCHHSYIHDRDTDLYYLQSRYYDPKVGRFLNADAYVSTGQGIIGNNMYTYCSNSPINGCDPCGTCFHRWDFWNDCEKCGGKTAKEKRENARGTFSTGFTVGFSTGIWSFGILAVRSVDRKGNVEYQVTPYGGMSTGTPQLDASVVGTITNAPDVSKLQGLGCNVGASGALGGALGIDGVIIPDPDENTGYTGMSISGGVGAGAEVHVTWGETYRIWGYNIYDVLDKWFGGEKEGT